MYYQNPRLMRMKRHLQLKFSLDTLDLSPRIGLVAVGLSPQQRVLTY